MHRRGAHTNLDGRLRNRFTLRVRFHVHSIRQALKLGLIQTRRLLHEQVERGLGRFELVALVFEVLHLVKDLGRQGPVVSDGVLGRLGQDGGLTR